MWKYLWVLLFLISQVGLSQRVNIPKGADRIEVATALSDSVLFETIQSYLNSEGFVVDKADIKRGTLTTEYRNVQGALQIRLLVNTKGSVATFKGQGSTEAMGFKYTNEPLLYKGLPTGIVKGGFISLSEVVQKFAKGNPDWRVHYLTP